MHQEPILLAAYPRSGSTWLRFIIVNTYWRKKLHDFNSMNKCFPGLDGEEGIADAEQPIRFLKTHELRHASNVIFLHRHIGDVLTSEWWYKKKFHDEPRSLHQYLRATEYGREWREHVDWYYPATYNIAYSDLNKANELERVLPLTDRAWIVDAMHESNFERMQKVEEKGFGIYPPGNKEIKFIRSGKSDQWKEWDHVDKIELLRRNVKQLTLLGYSTDETNI